MKKSFTLWTAAFLTFGTLCFGAEDERGTIRTRLCDQWRYNFQSNAYECFFLSNYVNLVTARSEEDRVAKLEERILELEKKIEALEKN